MSKFASLALVLAFAAACLAQDYRPPTKLLGDIDFAKATAIDPEYKQFFDACDKPGNRCERDPNQLRALLRFGDAAIYFDSKMALDLDGSYVGCNCGDSMGKSDQCSTSYFWKTFPDEYDDTDKTDRCKFYRQRDFVDSNEIPYVVIPGDFGEHLKVGGGPYDAIGDVGVVIYKNKVVPVIVADEGPNFRIGEGSAALFRALGQERCKTFQQHQCIAFNNFGIDNNVVFIIFPNSKTGKTEMNSDNALLVIEKEAMTRFANLKSRF